MTCSSRISEQTPPKAFEAEIRPRGPMTLGALCRQVGLARASVLHYESLGLLHPSGRSEAGYRLYGQPELTRLQAIRQLRAAGLTLADIQHLLSPVPVRQSDGGSPRPEALLEARLMALSRQVEHIQAQQRLLARLLAQPQFTVSSTRLNKAGWVGLLRRAGFDEAAMHTWHAEFERDDPQAHHAFLLALGLPMVEVQAIRHRAQASTRHSSTGTS